jgi:hypothetical protein
VARRLCCAVGVALTIGAAIGYQKFARPWMYTWGACAAEIDAVLPGDDLVAASAVRTTRGVTIDASPEAVWQWLVQIGEDRGGFYSYDWLERSAHVSTTRPPFGGSGSSCTSGASSGSLDAMDRAPKWSSRQSNRSLIW